MIMHFSSFVFNCPTKVLFGEHESASLTTFADELGIKKPLLITDRFLMEHGVIAPIIESLEDSGFDYETFLDVPPDSDIDAVNKAAEFGREKGCNSIIAVGGGSVGGGKVGAEQHDRLGGGGALCVDCELCLDLASRATHIAA